MPPTADAAPVRNFRSLHDVSGVAPQDGDLYRYNASTELMGRAILLARAREQTRAKWDDRLNPAAILAFLKGGAAK